MRDDIITKKGERHKNEQQLRIKEMHHGHDVCLLGSSRRADQYTEKRFNLILNTMSKHQYALQLKVKTRHVQKVQEGDSELSEVNLACQYNCQERSISSRYNKDQDVSWVFFLFFKHYIKKKNPLLAL